MSDSIDTISAAFRIQREDMRLCTDLMGGTKAMLAAGARYIPREDGEDDKAWKIRLERTILFNVYKRTLRYLCGRVFEKPIVLGDDVQDERFEGFCENVDRMGRNITTWGRHVFEAGLNDGVTFCVVDFNSVKTRRGESGVVQYQKSDGTWADKTMAADNENGWAPYFIHVDAGRVLDARMEWHNGKPRVAHFRYMETVEEADCKWGTRTYERIRAFYLDENGRPAWEVWSNNNKDDSAGWVLEDSGYFSLDVLPIAIFMPGEKRTSMTAEPAMTDLAQLNKRYWQATCGQYELMEYVRRPPWFGKRLGNFDIDTGKTKFIFGAGKLCHSTDENASLQSVGIDAANVRQIPITPDEVKKLSAVSPFPGTSLAMLVGAVFHDGVMGEVLQCIDEGMKEGWGYKKVVDKLLHESIDKGFQLTQTQAITLCRSYIQQASVNAQMAVYEKNSDVVKGVKWTAILDNRVCGKCAALDGMKFALDDIKPKMIAHPRCRCLWLPWLKSFRDLGIDMDDLEEAARPWLLRELGNIDSGGRKILFAGTSKENFSGWWKTLPYEEQIKSIGPIRTKLIS